MMMTLIAHVLVLLASSKLFDMNALISLCGIKYAFWVCSGWPDTFILFYSIPASPPLLTQCIQIYNGGKKID